MELAAPGRPSGPGSSHSSRMPGKRSFAEYGGAVASDDLNLASTSSGAGSSSLHQTASAAGTPAHAHQARHKRLRSANDLEISSSQLISQPHAASSSLLPTPAPPPLTSPERATTRDSNEMDWSFHNIDFEYDHSQTNAAVNDSALHEPDFSFEHDFSSREPDFISSNEPRVMPAPGPQPLAPSMDPGFLFAPASSTNLRPPQHHSPLEFMYTPTRYPSPVPQPVHAHATPFTGPPADSSTGLLRELPRSVNPQLSRRPTWNVWSNEPESTPPLPTDIHFPLGLNTGPSQNHGFPSATTNLGNSPISPISAEGFPSIPNYPTYGNSALESPGPAQGIGSSQPSPQDQPTFPNRSSFENPWPRRFFTSPYAPPSYPAPTPAPPNRQSVLTPLARPQAPPPPRSQMPPNRHVADRVEAWRNGIPDDAHGPPANAFRPEPSPSTPTTLNNWPPSSMTSLIEELGGRISTSHAPVFPHSATATSHHYHYHIHHSPPPDIPGTESLHLPRFPRRRHRMARFGDSGPGDTLYGYDPSGGSSTETRDRFISSLRSFHRAIDPRHSRRDRIRTLGDFVLDEDFDDSYEALIALTQQVGSVKRGCGPDIIEKLQTGSYADFSTPAPGDENGKGKVKGDDGSCAVCLEDYMEDDVCVKLPKCSHFYHKECVSRWLSGANTCPVCREPVEEKARARHVSPPAPGDSASQPALAQIPRLRARALARPLVFNSPPGRDRIRSGEDAGSDERERRGVRFLSAMPSRPPEIFWEDHDEPILIHVPPSPSVPFPSTNTRFPPPPPLPPLPMPTGRDRPRRREALPFLPNPRPPLDFGISSSVTPRPGPPPPPLEPPATSTSTSIAGPSSHSRFSRHTLSLRRDRRRLSDNEHPFHPDHA